MSNAPESNLKSFEAEASHSFGKRESTGDPDQTQVSTVMGMKAQLEWVQGKLGREEVGEWGCD